MITGQCCSHGHYPERRPVPHPKRSLCTLRRGRHLPRRNTRYRAGATPFPDRTFTGWTAPALPGAPLRLHCEGVSPSTPCRSPGAHWVCFVKARGQPHPCHWAAILVGRNSCGRTNGINPNENCPTRRSSRQQPDAWRAHGPASVNCRSSLRLTAEKLSSEISVNTVLPAGVW